MEVRPEEGGGLLYSSNEEICVEIEKASRSQSTLEDNHATLLRTLDSGDFNVSDLRGWLERNLSSLEGPRRFLDACRQSIPVTCRPCTSPAHQPKQVFCTTELFEHILLYLKPRDVLNVVQINRGAWSIGKGSSVVKDKLSLRRAEEGYLNSPFSSADEFDSSGFPAFNFVQKYRQDKVYHDDGTYKQVHRILVEAEFEVFKSLPKIGSCCRRMLIFQPVVRVMQIRLDCCEGHYPETQAPRRRVSDVRHPYSSTLYGEADEDEHLDDEGITINDVTKTLEIKNKTGITLGEVYDATQTLRDAHALCPYANLRMHDENGYVCPRIKFHSDVTLKSDDPYVLAQAEDETAAALGRISISADDKALGVYIQAKEKAQHSGWIIPTYAEFKKQHEKKAEQWRARTERDDYHDDVDGNGW